MARKTSSYFVSKTAHNQFLEYMNLIERNKKSYLPNPFHEVFEDIDQGSDKISSLELIDILETTQSNIQSNLQREAIEWVNVLEEEESFSGLEQEELENEAMKRVKRGLSTLERFILKYKRESHYVEF